MPLYEYSCECGTTFEKYLAVLKCSEPQPCICGRIAKKKISLPMVFIQADISYRSPIDDRPITSMKARIEDLARNGCSPYDPEQKTDYNRRHKESEEKLEKAVEETVERELATMPTRKREKLEAELQGGMTAEPIRTTPNVKPLIKEIQKYD